MALLYAATVEELGSTRAPNSKSAEIAQTHDSAVSWSAVVAGPIDAAALALILLILGAVWACLLFHRGHITGQARRLSAFRPSYGSR